MPDVTTKGELLRLLRAGAHVVQAFEPRWPGDRPREIFYLQKGDAKRAVQKRLVLQEMRSKRLVIVDAGLTDGVSPRLWRLVPNQKQGIR